MLSMILAAVAPLAALGAAIGAGIAAVGAGTSASEILVHLPWRLLPVSLNQPEISVRT